MKLFLASKSLLGELGKRFVEFVEKPAHKIRFCLIENAGDPYPEEKKGFIHETRNDIHAAGISFDLLDLQKISSPEELKEKLAGYDVIWISGGNTYYLRWIMQKSGFDKIMPGLLENGVVYGGGSAGAIVAGPTLQGFESLDDPEKSQELILHGLNLVDLIVIPHWGREKYQERLNAIQKHFEETGLTHVAISDSQAVEVNNLTWKVVE